MFRDGFLTLGTWRGVPVRMHWTAPLGALVFGRFEFVPAFWLGFALLIVLHELGHAFVVQRVGAQALSVDVLAMGGLCTWRGEVSRIQRAAIAWGGIWAQALGLFVALIVLSIHGPPGNAALAQWADVFTRANLWMMAFNLLPVRPLDGAQAWPLFPLLWRRLRERRRARRRENVRKELSRRDELDAQLDDPPAEVKEAVRNLFTQLKEEERGGSERD